MAYINNLSNSLYALLHANLTDCVTTTFLCAWAAYHPDVPDPNENVWKSRGRRLAQAISGLLAPETVLTAALSDCIFSRRALQELKASGMGPNWTQTHASFAYMGGFLLRKRDNTTEALYKYEFFKRVMEGKIDLPVVQADEIWDKSKTDSFGKLIVVFHTLWFIAKFIFGPISDFTTLPAGFVTLSLVLVNLFCYACWWNKPANVRIPIAVYERIPAWETAQRGGELSAHPSATVIIVQPLPPDEQFSSGKGLWLSARSLYIKLTFLLTLIIGGAILSGVNFLAVPFQQFPTFAENAAWLVCAAIVCFGSFLLFLIFFSFVVFTKGSEIPSRSRAWLFVAGMSILIGCARLCLIVLAIIALGM